MDAKSNGANRDTRIRRRHQVHDQHVGHRQRLGTFLFELRSETRVVQVVVDAKSNGANHDTRIRRRHQVHDQHVGHQQRLETLLFELSAETRVV